MNRVALSIVGGLMGLGSGLLFLQPVSAFFSATTITWIASTCPPGVYSITSYVRGDDGIIVDSVTSKNVSLPKATFTQQFTKLPARSWQAVAITTGGERAFRSTTQTIQGLGVTDGDRFGRSRPAANPVTGVARSRTAPATPPPPTDPRSTPPASVSSSSPILSSERPSVGLAVSRLLQTYPWRQLIVEDLDSDGVADVITIETEAGGLFVIRLDGKSSS